MTVSEGGTAVAAYRLDRDTQRQATGPAVRAVADHAFEILGGTAADGVDIAATFAAASVRMGDSVWVAYARWTAVPPAGCGSARRRCTAAATAST